MIKTCLFYVSVLSCDEDEAVRWATEVLKMSKVNCFTKLNNLIVDPPQILTGHDSYQTQSWDSSVNNVRSYFLDKESLLKSVSDWTLDI